MKKLALVLTVFLCVAGFSTQAMAYFEDGKLILSVYNENDMDLGIDLGVAADLATTTEKNVLLAEAGTVSLDKFNVGSLSDLSAAAWSTEAATYSFYMGITETTAYSLNFPLLQSFMGSSFSVAATGYGDSNNGGQTALISSADLNSYDINMNVGSNSPGTMAGFISGSYLSEVNLELLETQGYADLNLYAYNFMADQSVAAGGFDPNAVIRIMDDGSVILNPVPVPGALILLSSGLLGLIGIRRKNA